MKAPGFLVNTLAAKMLPIASMNGFMAPFAKYPSADISLE